MDELIRMTAREAVRLLKSREVSPRDLIDAAEQRVRAVDGAVNAMPTRCFDRARAFADRLERPEDPPPGYLYGLPVGIKDLVEVSGVRTTWGSRVFENHISTRSDYSIERLEANGAAVVGKTNTPEFGAGAQTFNDVLGTTTNPWNTALTPSGSSGGSAVAVVTGEVWLADGSDLGGSLRTPASFTAAVGLRPSPGRVAAGPKGLPFDTLGVLGPMARNVGDLALMLDAQAGMDPRDPISLPAPDEPFQAAPERALSLCRLPSRFAGGCRIGWSPDLGIVPVDKEVAALCEAAVKRLEKMGAAVTTEVPSFQETEDCFRVMRAANFAAGTWPRIRHKPDLVKPEVLWNAQLGLKLTGEELALARQQQTALYQRLSAFFEKHDFLCVPAAIVPPFPHTQRYIEEVPGEKFESYISWVRITYAITLTSAPALVLPVGFTKSGLPVGMQLVARPRGEAELLGLAALLEADLGIAARLPIDPMPPKG